MWIGSGQGPEWAVGGSYLIARRIAMTIEDSWGGDITTAAIAHLAHSTPSDLLFSSTDFNSYVTVSFADGAPPPDGEAQGGSA